MPFDDTIPEGHETLAAKWAVFGGFVDLIAERLAQHAHHDEVAVTAMRRRKRSMFVLPSTVT